MQGSTKTFQIITHGNNGFESSQILKQLGIRSENYTLDIKISQDENVKMKFFPFSDLNLFNQNIPIKPLIAHTPKEVEASSILVLISLTEIFSEGMRKMILNLPSNEFYGKTTKKEWWERVIIVFSFGECEGELEKIQETITRNRGIREIVGKVRDRYIWMSDLTTPEELINKLHMSIEKIKGSPFVDKPTDGDIQVVSKQPTCDTSKEKENLLQPSAPKKFPKCCIFF